MSARLREQRTPRSLPTQARLSRAYPSTGYFALAAFMLAGVDGGCEVPHGRLSEGLLAQPHRWASYGGIASVEDVLQFELLMDRGIPRARGESAEE